MTLGLFLILIVTLPFTIYLYIVNKKLKIQIEDLEKKQKTLLERKIYASLEKDVLPLKNLIKNCRISKMYYFCSPKPFTGYEG